MKKCKNCRNDLPQADLFCSHCGATQKVVGKSKRWIGILFAVILVGVVATIYFGKDKLFNKEIKDIVNEKKLNSSETNDEVEIETEEDPLVVQQTSKTMSITELEKNALYSLVVQSGSDEAKVFIVPTKSEGVVTFGPDDSSFMGEEGDDVYTGGIRFYLAEVNGNKGYLQKGNEVEVMLNLTREPFHSYTIDGKTMIAVHEALNSNDYDLYLTVFDKGQMTLVDTLNTSTTELKIIKDTYIQTYSYNNGEPVGWTFMTYEWGPKQNELSFIDTYELTIDEDVYDFDMYFDAYKEVVDEWHTYPYAYQGFPHISLSDDFVEELNKGKFLGEEIPLGESIEDFIKENPDHLGTDYYEGGPFYNYPSGELYFFDEITGEINQFVYGGSSLQTTVTEFIELVGEPIEDTGSIDEDDPAYDYFIDNYHMMIFEHDKYSLTVEYEDDKIITIWINQEA